MAWALFTDRDRGYVGNDLRSEVGIVNLDKLNVVQEHEKILIL